MTLTIETQQPGDWIRQLSCNPGWLIADEPTKGLDAVARKQVLERLQGIWTDRRCGMIVCWFTGFVSRSR